MVRIPPFKYLHGIIDPYSHRHKNIIIDIVPIFYNYTHKVTMEVDISQTYRFFTNELAKLYRHNCSIFTTSCHLTYNDEIFVLDVDIIKFYYNNEPYFLMPAINRKYIRIINGEKHLIIEFSFIKMFETMITLSDHCVLP